MAADLLFATDPIARVSQPLPARPASAPKPPVGIGMAGNLFGFDINLPEPPRTCYDLGWVRFKIQCEAKCEAVFDQAGTVAGTFDPKVDAVKQKASIQAGLKAKLTETIEASAKVKLSADSLRHTELAIEDPKKFALSLLRYLEVVLGKNFKLDGDLVKFIGVGLALDTDFCFLSVLVPVSLPFTFKPGGVTVGGKLTTQIVIKFGPSKRTMFAIAKRLGKRRAARWVIETLLPRLAQTLPADAAAAGSAAATGATAALAEAVLLWVGVAAAAVPIAVAVTEFTARVCREARLRGVRDGDLMTYAVAYCRRVYDCYGQPTEAERQANLVKAAAVAQADADIDTHGELYLRQYLEQNFWDRKRGYPGKMVAGDLEVTALGERLWLHLRARYN